MAKLICMLGFAATFTQAFRVGQTGGEQCCCKEGRVSEAECNLKGYLFKTTEAGKELCCTIKANGCPLASHYKKQKTMTNCQAGGVTGQAGGDIAARNSMPEQEDNVDEEPDLLVEGEGAYLTYSIADHGTLTTTWSKTTVEGALAFISPQKPVPAHKFQTNQGRSFYKNSGDSSTRSYRKGFANFAKIGKAYDGVLTLSQDANVQLVFLGNDDTVTIVEPGTPVPLAGQAFVVGVHKSVSTFKLSSMQPQTFLNKVRDSNADALTM